MLFLEHLFIKCILFPSSFVSILRTITHLHGVMTIAKVFKSTPTFEEECHGNKSSDHRRFHLDSTICNGYITNVSKSISHQESGILQPWQYLVEQRRQYHLCDLRVPTPARACQVLIHLQFGQHRPDVGLVPSVRRLASTILSAG